MDVNWTGPKHWYINRSVYLSGPKAWLKFQSHATTSPFSRKRKAGGYYSLYNLTWHDGTWGAFASTCWHCSKSWKQKFCTIATLKKKKKREEKQRAIKQKFQRFFPTASEVLEYYSQCLMSVTSCFGNAAGNAVITSLALGCWSTTVSAWCQWPVVLRKLQGMQLSLHWPWGVGVLQSVLDVSDQLFWESCRECSYHFTGLGAPRTVPSRATPDER